MIIGEKFMTLFSTQIAVTVECASEELASIIVKSLEPENKMMEEPTEIRTIHEGKKVKISIASSMGISSLRYTLDDILYTISVIEKIYQATKNKWSNLLISVDYRLVNLIPKEKIKENGLLLFRNFEESY